MEKRTKWRNAPIALAVVASLFATGAFFTQPSQSVESPKPVTPVVSPDANADLPLGEDWWVGGEDDWKGEKIGENIIPPEIDCSKEGEYPDCIEVPEVEDSVTEGLPEMGSPSNALTSDEVMRMLFSLYPTERAYKARVRVKGDWSVWSRPVSLNSMIERVRVNLRRWGGYARFAKADGSLDWSPWMPRKKAVKEYRQRLATKGKGSVWYIQTKRQQNTHSTRIIIRTLIYDTQGTPPIDRVITALKKRFDNWSVWGILACRAVAGTSTWSQHAYANAVDLGASSSKMREIATWVANHRKLPVSQVIYARQVWTPTTGWHYYGGVNPHYDHVHISGEPYLTGTPRCAR